MKNYIMEYAEMIDKGKIVACRRIKAMYKDLVNQIEHPQILQIPKKEGGFEEREYIFSLEHANRPIEFIEKFCKQSKGEWIGKSIELQLFQKAKFQSIFGFVDKETGLRRYNEVLTNEGRKNGKSTEQAGTGIYMSVGDGEGGPEVVCVATKKDQAKIVFDEAKNMVTQSKELKKYFHKRKSDLYVPFNFGTFKPLASDSDTLDGANASCVIIDELHAIKDRNLYDVFKQSISARKQPLILIITTAGFVRDSIYDELYTLACNSVDGIDGFYEPRSLYFLYELDARSEWEDYNCWEKANPGLGTIKKFSALAENVEKAKKNAAFLPTVLTKDFNIREGRAASWLNYESIVNEKVENMEYLKNSYAIGGCDLSATTDLTCATLLIRKPDNKNFYVLQQYFLPENRINILENTKSKEAPYKLWNKQNWLTLCDGVQVNYSDVTKWFWDMVQIYNIRPLWICYDRALSGYWVPEMEALGFNMQKIAQGAFTWSQSMKEMGAAFEAHTVIYQNNPILRWCLSNVGVKSINPDGIETIQPVKLAQNRRIDGMVSLLNAWVGFNKFYEVYSRYIK